METRNYKCQWHANYEQTQVLATTSSPLSGIISDWLVTKWTIEKTGNILDFKKLFSKVKKRRITMKD